MTWERGLELLLGNLGLLVAMIFVFVAGHWGWWVWGKTYREMQTKCEASAMEMKTELRNQITKLETRLVQSERRAERVDGLARRAVEVAERHVEPPHR